MIFRLLRRGRPCLQESQGRKEVCQGLRICPHRKRDRHSDNVSQIYFLWQGRPFVKIYKHIISQLANFVKLFIVKTGIKNGRTNCSPAKIFILLESYLIFDISYQLVDLDTLLLHCISVSYCYTAVLNRIKVICDAEWCTDLVLTAISLTDRACLVIVNKEVL